MTASPTTRGNSSDPDGPEHATVAACGLSASPPGRVLVTGAAGFVGTAVCAHLRARGHDVIAAARAASPGGTAVGDFVDADWDRMLEARPDSDAVVHLAALAHRPTGPGEADYERANVEVTRRLVEAAKRRRLRRLVFVSSVKVNGEATSDRPFTDADPARPEDAYGRSKWAAEQVVGAASPDIETVILRPPLVYGPGVKANFLALLRVVDRGWPLPLASVRNRRSLLSLANLAAAIEVSLEHPALAGGTFLIADGEDVSTPELVRRIAQAMDRPARLVPCPPGLLAFAARLAGRGDAARRLTGSLCIDGRRFRALTGWSPPCPLDRGIAETVTWYRRTRSRTDSRAPASV